MIAKESNSFIGGGSDEELASMPIAAPMPPRSVVRAVRCAGDGTGPSDFSGRRLARPGLDGRRTRADDPPSARYLSSRCTGRAAAEDRLRGVEQAPLESFRHAGQKNPPAGRRGRPRRYSFTSVVG